MRFVSDDGSFGFRMTPSNLQRFYIFQLIFGVELLGDEELCLAGSCFGPLATVRDLHDLRLQPGVMTQNEIDRVLIEDDRLNDGSLKDLAESLDGWITKFYRVGERVYINAREDGPGVTHRASLASSEFDAIVATMHTYWEECEEQQ